MFLKQRISTVNIIEILSFSHIDFSLEVHASDFLARNFSTFLSTPDRKVELLELPVDKMKLVLNSKLLVLRDELSFPLKAVVREGNILKFVLEYIHHREAARLRNQFFKIVIKNKFRGKKTSFTKNLKVGRN